MNKMKRKGKILLTFIAVFFLSNSLFAVSSIFETTGKNSGLPGEFSTEYGFNARNLAMGKTGVGDSSDSSTIYYNPAGMGFLNYAEMSVMYSLLYLGGNYFSAGYVHPFTQNDVIGFGVTGVFIGGVERLDDFGLSAGGDYSYSDNCFMLAYSRKLTQKLSMGADFKIASQFFDSKNSFGVGLDLGVMFRVSKYFQAGLALQNIIGPYIKLEETTEKYPFNFKIGTATSLLNRDLHILADAGLVDILNYAGAASADLMSMLRYHVGVEYVILNLVPVRLGWDGSEFDAGAGFAVRKTQLDYAIAVHTLNLSHRFSMKTLLDVPATKKEQYLDEKERNVNNRLFLVQADEYAGAEDIEKAKAAMEKLDQVSDDDKPYQAEVNKKIVRLENIKKAQTLLADAEGLFKDRKFNASLKKIEDAFSLYPDYTEAKALYNQVLNSVQAEENYNAAKKSFEIKDYTGASEKLRLALKLFPDNQEYKKFDLKLRPFINQAESISRCNVASDFLAKKYYDRALDEVNKAIELNPENTDASSLKGKILYEISLSFYNEALTLFNSSEYNLVIDKCDKISGLASGNEKIITEQYQNVVAKAVKLSDQAKSKIHINKAKNLLEAKDYNNMEKELIEALKLDPESKEAADMYGRLKKIRELFK